jgi:hypothetical protein
MREGTFKEDQYKLSSESIIQNADWRKKTYRNEHAQG